MEYVALIVTLGNGHQYVIWYNTRDRQEWMMEGLYTEDDFLIYHAIMDAGGYPRGLNPPLPNIVSVTRIGFNDEEGEFFTEVKARIVPRKIIQITNAMVEAWNGN